MTKGTLEWISFYSKSFKCCFLVHSALYILWYSHVCIKGWRWNGSKCYWIKKQIEQFHIHLSIHLYLHHSLYIQCLRKSKIRINFQERITFSYWNQMTEFNTVLT